MKVTTWVKRRQSDGQAVTQVKRLSLVTDPEADRVENLEGYSRRPSEAMGAGDSGGVGEHGMVRNGSVMAPGRSTAVLVR